MLPFNQSLHGVSNISGDNQSGTGDSLTGPVDTPGLRCDWFTFVLYVLVLGILCLFGLVGNTLSFLVLRAEKHCHVATFLLQTMAVADNMFLLTTGLSQMTMALAEFVESRLTANGATDLHKINVMYNYNVLNAYVQVYVWPLVHVSQMWTVWITVLVAFNRYVAICLPFRATRLCTMKQARIQVTVNAVIIIIYNIPRFLEHRINFYQLNLINQSSQNNTLLTPVFIPVGDKTPLKESFVYNIVYENVLYCLFIYLGPLVILVILNTCLVRELCLARRRLRERHLPPSVAGPEQGEHNLTLVMIVIIIVFVVCQTPALVNQLLYVIGVTDECNSPYFYYYHLSNMIVTSNSAVNFAIYCVFRRHFRRRLRVFCGCATSDSQRRGSDGSLLQHTEPLETYTMRASSITTNARQSLSNHNHGGTPRRPSANHCH